MSSSFSQTSSEINQATPLSVSLIPLWSALIGATSALLTIFMKEYIFVKLHRRESKRLSEIEIYRQYLAPLCSISEKLTWRFKEIFIDKRHQFLLSSTLPLAFNQYKRNSTLYRIAVFIGWMRAIEMELNALPRGGSSIVLPISDQLEAFRKALADGLHVELYRLEQIASVWGIDLQSLAREDKIKLATKFEVAMYGAVGERLKEDQKYLETIGDEERLEICCKLADFICTSIGRKKMDRPYIKETVSRVISSLSYRESLIYRDWQDAIGDSMLERDHDSVRRFKVIGYQLFEQLLTQDTPWMKVFSSSIVDINFDEIDPNDFRSKQIKDIAIAVSNLIVAVSESEDKDLIAENTLGEAKKLVAQS